MDEAKLMHMILDYDALLDQMQRDIYRWVNQSVTGGWSTNLVDPLLKKAQEISILRACYETLIERIKETQQIENRNS